jgi:osmotically-inducible protein OsmY
MTRSSNGAGHFPAKKLLTRHIAAAAACVGLSFGVLAYPVLAQGNDAKIDQDLHHSLDNKRFSGVQAHVQNGNVTLTGTVNTYSDKMAADRKAHRVDHVKGVDNEIQVAGGETNDQQLRDKLSKQLTYYMVGYGTTAFDNINVGVKNGVVTLSGTVYGPYDKDSAVSIVENTPGVRDVVDDLQVAPVSPMDDQLRLRLARVIYGDPALQKYALDPAKPIRITVVNGNVLLSGVVDSKMDKDIAGVRANSVPGVFKVVNNIQVQGAQANK